MSQASNELKINMKQKSAVGGNNMMDVIITDAEMKSDIAKQSFLEMNDSIMQ